MTELKCDLKEYKTTPLNNDYKEALAQLKLINLDNIETFFIMFDNILELEKNLSVIDKYTLLLYDLNETNENLKLKQKHWETFSDFLSFKNCFFDNVTKQFKKEELLKYIDENKKYDNYRYYIDDIYTMNFSSEENGKSMADLEKIRDEFYAENKLSKDEKIKYAVKYITLREQVSNDIKYLNTLNEKLAEDGITEEVFERLLTITKMYNDVEFKIKEILKDSDENSSYPLERGFELIKESLGKFFGTDYVKLIEKLIDNNCIDTVSNKAKTNRPATYGSYDHLPVILLKYENDLESMRILIHEIGHAVHLIYHEKNDYVNFDYNSFLGEAIALTNELVLLDYMYNNTNNVLEKKEILKSLLLFYNWIFIDASKSLILEKYFHDNYKCLSFDEIEKDEKWEEHISRVFDDYYDYKYAFGLCIATSLLNKIKNQDISYDDYINILKSRAHQNITEILKEYIDLSNSKNIENMLKETYKIINNYIDKYNCLN
ncbi:MAG: hypothetical protein V8R01_03305 [Bacilli bacterium]